MTMDIALEDWGETQIKRLNSQKSSHTSPSWVSYGMAIVRTSEKMNHVVMAPHCSSLQWLAKWSHWRLRLISEDVHYGHIGSMEN